MKVEASQTEDNADEGTNDVDHERGHHSRHIHPHHHPAQTITHHTLTKDFTDRDRITIQKNRTRVLDTTGGDGGDRTLKEGGIRCSSKLFNESRRRVVRRGKG